MKATSIFSAVVLLLTTAPALAAGAGGDARVRVVHASPDAPAVDVLVDGQRALTDIEFREVTSYAPLRADQYDVEVVPGGLDAPVVIDLAGPDAVNLVAMPLLTAIFDVVGIFGAYLVGVRLLGVSSGSFFAGMENSVVFHDVYSGFVKSLSFGLIITWICCYKGFHAPPMATGVSQATTESVVLSFVIILVWDYFLTSIML